MTATTPSRRQRDRRYNVSEKGRTRHRRYNNSPKGYYRYVVHDIKRKRQRLEATMAELGLTHEVRAEV